MNQNPPTPSGTPAPYGHACMSCAQSKCKCIIRPIGGPCERCHRLNRECRPGESIRRRNHKRPAVAKTKKAAQLEEKLDGLISLIKTGASGGSVVASPLLPVSTAISPPNSNAHTELNTHPYRQLGRGSPSTTSDNNTQSIPDLTADSDCFSSYKPSIADAEECLSNFRTDKLKYFPFINITSKMTANQLRRERPFLWLCIMAISSKSSLQQQILSRKIRQMVAQEMIIGSTKSMDLLLGILAFIGWTNANFKVQRETFMTLFSQLAVSLVYDLGLAKPASRDPELTLCGNRKYARPTIQRTMEERRAVLSCFLITSILSSFFQKIDALRWTSHMDDCLQRLSEEKECPNDEILVKLVQLQLIIESSNQKASRDEAIEPIFNLQSMHSQLQAVKNNILRDHQKDEILLLHLYSAELETTLSPFLHGKPLTLQQETIDASLASIKSWFDVFFTITPDTYIGFPSSIFSQLFRCLVMLYKIKTISDPMYGGDFTGEMDPVIILDRVVSNLEQVEVLAGLDNSGVQEKDTFFQLTQIFRAIRSGWEAELRSNEPELPNITMSQNADEISFSDFLGMDFLDNDWLADFYFPSNHN
ncbi:hypothetical protein F4811DRAFT_459927 [Daldinia bambusicola]|nr:hypothetical protein F4811DRAFT_459927 [Daldinia bambusicola]